MLVTLIAVCEVLFWVLLAWGLTLRYVLRRPRAGAVLLLLLPVCDLLLLGATVADLRDGATAQFPHGLAAAYLGFSLAFGPGLVRWADVRFAHHFADGPAPTPVPRSGPERVRHEWHVFARAALAWAISCGLLLLAIALVADGDRTAALLGWIQRLSLVLAIWAIWPISYTIRPGPDPSRAPEATR
ncbi:hypothetical protein [Patulibacter defluvii]|uniref:hypothetical protein n=1 Tax=Patulibacter defluvii TaxID=3095358 RepID=UPI002A758990|nr:hypothetical protein [Patulibacter sp. DM4]